MLELKGPFAVVVVQGVPREVVEGVGFFGVTGFLANDEGQFDFPVRFVPVAGKDQVVVGAAKAEEALKKMTGSSGISIPDSSAWSTWFNPMQTILLGRAMGEP